jgi:hypothetical protein
MKDKGMDAADLDLEDLPPKALRKLIKSMLSKMGKHASDKDVEDTDDERQKLSDLHAEHKGKPPSIPVQDDDLPEFMKGDDEDDDEVDDPSEVEEEGDDTKAKKKSPPKKGGKMPAFLKKKGDK